MNSPITIVGYGDVGERLADRLIHDRQDPIYGVIRDPGRTRRLLARGVRPIHADLDVPSSLSALSRPHQALVYLAPPPAAGETDPRLAALLACLAADPAALPARLIYASTTGVYGDCQGAWIGEDHRLAATSGRGLRRVDAEHQVRRFAQAHGVPWLILRLPAIYGPGRLPLARLQRGEPTICEADLRAANLWSNRIHVTDLVRSLAAALAPNAPTQQAIHIGDGTPTTMTDYFVSVARAVGLPTPPCVELDEARQTFRPELLSFLLDSKRLTLDRMREALGITPRVTNLQAGLRRC